MFKVSIITVMLKDQSSNSSKTLLKSESIENNLHFISISKATNYCFHSHIFMYFFFLADRQSLEMCGNLPGNWTDKVYTCQYIEIFESEIFQYLQHPEVATSLLPWRRWKQLGESSLLFLLLLERDLHLSGWSSSSSHPVQVRGGPP